MPVVHNIQNFDNSHGKQIDQNIIQTNKKVFVLFIKRCLKIWGLQGVRYNASGINEVLEI